MAAEFASYSVPPVLTACADSALYAFGGVQNGSVVHDLWRLEPTKNSTWSILTTTETFLQTGDLRSLQYGTTDGARTKPAIWCNQTSINIYGFNYGFRAYNITGHEWTDMTIGASAPPAFLDKSATFAINDRVHIVGGEEYGLGTKSNATYIYDGKSWQMGPVLPFTPVDASGGTLGGNGYILGGMKNAGEYAPLWRLDAEKWTQIDTVSPANSFPRERSCMISWKYLVIYGGRGPTARVLAYEGGRSFLSAPIPNLSVSWVNILNCAAIGNTIYFLATTTASSGSTNFYNFTIPSFGATQGGDSTSGRPPPDMNRSESYAMTFILAVLGALICMLAACGLAWYYFRRNQRQLAAHMELDLRRTRDVEEELPPYSPAAADDQAGAVSVDVLYIPPPAVFSEDSTIQVEGLPHADVMVTTSYLPQTPREMELRVGDVIRQVSILEDGKASGVNGISGARGLFPLSCVMAIKDEGDGVDA